MNFLRPPLWLGLVLSLSIRLAAADSAKASEYVPAPVSVSSANYAETSRERLLALVYDKPSLNPPVREVGRKSQVQRYVFLPGDLYEMDLTYEDVCQRVAAALAKKGFENAEDAQGRVIAPGQVDLILRVSAGERPWRNPTVRTESLTWHDGLVARPRGRTLATLGGEVSWEDRAGGNDDALNAAAQNESAPGFGGFGTGGGRATSSGAALSTATTATAAQAGAAPTQYDSTRDFYLIVVDAFNYQELRTKGDRAKRQWTTFVAAPRQPGQKFSNVLNTMLRIAAPYFGENTSGLQVYNDARASVELGTLKVIESDVAVPRGH